MTRIWRTTTNLFGAVIAVFLASITSLPTYALSLSLQNGANAAKGTDQVTNMFGATGIFNTITNIMLFLVGAISVLMIIIGGFRYVVSGGNSTSVSAAKNTILYAVIGIIVAILAYAVINFVISSFAPGTGGNGFAGGTNA
jgi:multisubunit Na+/H+ antiporter MnhB subunit